MSTSQLRPVSGIFATVVILAACGGSSGESVTVPPPPPPPAPATAGETIALERAFPQLSFAAPLALLQAPGDSSRWYVVSQAGVIHVFANQSSVSSSTVFADLTGTVDASASESGLLGMAFHPDFANNREVYLSYTRSGSPFDSVVSRFVASSADALDTGSEEILLTVAQDSSNHNGGHLAFGSDGLLYVGFGDGGGRGDPNNRAQTISNILGSIVRIDVDGAAPYEIPASNPFAGSTECRTGFGANACPEIYAFGLRNPWRFSFDRQTGTLWAGDVGQSSWEEINRVEAGMNYGWRQREGAHCFNPATGCLLNNVDPVVEYGRSEGGSVTGGYVYRGAELPALAGHYLFGDFISGRIFSVLATSQQGEVATERFESTLNIASFGEANNGELYVVDYASGTLHKVVDGP
ncbi:MAG: PQQ-dependent sugar dehydrogenase [Woeseia sp.]